MLISFECAVGFRQNPHGSKEQIAKMPIVFCHFPKAGGSSIAQQLREEFRDTCLPDYDHDPLGSHGKETVDRLPPDINAVLGHFCAQRYDAVERRFLFTFLRQPIDNLLSVYFFWQSYPRSSNPWHQRFLDEAPDILSFARYEPLQRLMSGSYFGGFDMKRFNFIGFHETRSVDIGVLNGLTGLRLRAEVHENKTVNGAEQREEIMHDRKIMNALETLLVEDMRFYRTIWLDRAR